ncbi:unnamed protein product [Ilex paraguariensis]|uniref:DUF4378 domain-containing protein n=1 Tax=Ilex paraguariensis TaxID=185542 RepID=A0ABC8TAL5_9AQUA
MATKSDFAQKLLHDLRRRKERMAASQSSSSSNTMSRDAHGNPGQTYRGSQKIKAPESVGSKTVTSQRRQNGGNRVLTLEESSQQIVPYGRGRNSEQLGDLSMALTFALQNGGKLSKLDSSGNDSMLGFLRHIGRKSLDIVKIQRRSSFDKHRPPTIQFPTISHLHIKDISRGVQNLNQILRACSNGLNFDGYSIEIGKELLKGAMDLEESLRVLANLQEASEYMISPQRKSRIRLLEEDEEDEDNTGKIVEQKQLDLPRFSFDKPSRNSHGNKEVVRTDRKQRLLALTYATEAATQPKKQAPTTSNLMPHRRSTSCGPDFKSLSPFQETRNHSSSFHSTQEKGRTANVIAKLMGLEEPPEKVDSQIKEKDSSLQQKGMVMQKTEHARTKNVTPKIKNVENQAPHTIKEKLIQANKIPPNRVTTFTQRPEKIQETTNAYTDMMLPNGKPQRRDLEKAYGIDAVSGSTKTATSINIKQSSIIQLNHLPGSHWNIQENERGHNNPMQKEQKSTEKGQTREPVLKDERQQRAAQKHRSPDIPDILQENAENNEIAIQVEKQNANRLLPSNQQKPRDNYGLHQLHMLQNIEHQQEKHHVEKRKQTAKEKMQPRKLKGSQAEPKVSLKPTYGSRSLQKKQAVTCQTTPSKISSMQPTGANSAKELPNSKHNEDLARDESSTNSIANPKKSKNGKSDQKATLSGGVPSPIQENPVHVPATWKKVDYMQVQRSETPKKIAGVMTRQNGTLRNTAKPLKRQISILQEMKQTRHDKTSSSRGEEKFSANWSKEAEVGIIGSNKSQPTMQPLNGVQQLHNEAEKTTTLYSSVGDPKVPQALISSDSTENIDSEVFMVPQDHQRQATILREDPELNSYKNPPNLLNVAADQKRSMEIGILPQHEHSKMSTSGTPEPLTENGKHLRKILMTSQLFLNTAEALFKLNIPVDILHVRDPNCHDEDAKLILDCGYEVMKRKGRRQELTTHPSVKISICYVNISSFNDLVTQLYKDFEMLRAYGREGREELNDADYLLKMLERDVQNRDPDVNGMWDCGWNEKMFAFLDKDGVIKDVERHVLNGLIDEITQDLLYVTASV